MTKYENRGLQKNLKEYSEELASLYEPEINLRKDRKTAGCVQAGGVNTNQSKVMDSKLDWMKEVEPDFHSVPLFMHSSPISDLWQDTVSISQSPSSLKGMSEDSVECRKRLDFNYIDVEPKNQYAEIDSNLYRHSSQSTDYCHSNARTKKSDQLDHFVFELIKSQCLCKPQLMEKVIEWSISQSKCSRITREDVLKLSQGRLWITVKSAKPQGGKEQEGLRNALDNIKGAYQEVQEGVYKQPKPKGCETRIQHRLRKDSVRLWLIEKYDSASCVWAAVARELPDGQWKYCSYNQVIQVVVIPMRKILGILRAKACLYQDVESCVEFLFNSCDQRKLNGKLKTRNLKHNIANLRIKLEKQYSLSFAILVANTAEKMTNDPEFWHTF